MDRFYYHHMCQHNQPAVENKNARQVRKPYLVLRDAMSIMNKLYHINLLRIIWYCIAIKIINNRLN